jgi:hypothetical protein
MPLTPFEIGSETYSVSITMDASTVGATTVTTGVCAAREHEPTILDAMYEHGSDIEFKPFYHKANDFDISVRRDLTEAVLAECSDHVTAFAHQQQYGRNEDTEQIEAVHSALLVHDLLNDLAVSPVVIVDGNEQQAQPFVDALSGLRDDHPVIAHCQRSELYYPTALLADLTSNYLAHRLENTTLSSPPSDHPVRAPVAKHARKDDWGRAMSAIYQDQTDYSPPALPALRGDTVQERITCWHQGAVAPDSSADRPLSGSVRRVVVALERAGYEDLADTLQEL